jgi:hypothetical protein
MKSSTGAAVRNHRNAVRLQMECLSAFTGIRSGLKRAEAHEHYHYALCVIAWRLNGRQKTGAGPRRLFIAANREGVEVKR